MSMSVSVSVNVSVSVFAACNGLVTPGCFSPGGDGLHATLYRCFNLEEP